ncbi:ATP-dependent RecD-like DNA helicase [Streptococcus agalactiae]|nr:exodeoxyribonuclease V subunit alpha [Streptococcus agalactiae 138P]AHX75529.1 exodeoxyribonuclease V subunit alpha [Streptococcus agalactiae]AKU02282.1 exodeoxyribonuclease V subunit alpha [Streptococcus agalactiae]AWQ29858.1 ATP-dependent RecD-like DNA helicase [Streptococcus agalactiae]OVF15625.1 exodeoxyribonuclease V subunit alpha [Streptococcus agalactiae]
MEVFFTGTIERIIFENASNFFKILLLEIEDTDSDFDDVEVIITGTIADVIEGEEYTFWGTLTQHPKYGEQLQSVRYERAKPTSGGLVKYFSSEQFKGIGKKTAQRIVELYGDNTIDKILESPEQLSTISGLSKINREAFIAKLKLNYGTEQVLAKLAEYGLSNRAAIQIFDHYKEESLEVINENPYQLVEDIQGIGFKIADQLAEQVGIESDSPKRFRAAIIHTLVESSMEQGDTYIEARTLLEKTITLLEEARQIELDPSIVAKELTNLIAEDKVQHIGTKIFSNTLFFAEEGIKKNLQRILNQPLDKQLSHKDIDREIRDIQKSLNIHYDNIQEKAIREALLSKVFILTGGPGTGKTTVINGIIEAYSELHHIDYIPIVLAAPTGRAARRMNELTGLPSATIHRHLGLNGDSDYQSLDDYLDCSLIIIDEFSMVDTWLANQLFDALDSHTQIIIVGDSDQLPSVGPGQVLADLLNINALPHVKLEKIFRQSEESTIVTLANQMRQGFLPEDFTAKKADRSYFEASANIIPNMISKIVQSALKSGIEAHEIQILAPMYRGQAGINNLNLIMQNLLNPLKDNNQFTFNDINFRIGDKVLHLVNDTELNVFNGDIGYITDLIPAKYTESKQDEIYMTFDGQEVIYQRKEWLKITLAYAMSIHKSQGSEFQVVILPITRQSGRMLQRNLIYTAITRSKSKLILLGEIGAFDFAVKNEGAKRNTYLIERFENKQEIANSQKIEDSSIDQKTDSTIINTSIPKTATPIEQTNLSKITYRLTEENYLTIDPMIGINQQDISAIFDSK